MNVYNELADRIRGGRRLTWIDSYNGPYGLGHMLKDHCMNKTYT